MPNHARPAPSPAYRPLLPEPIDQGDPFVLAPPPEAGSRYRYYVYTTGEEPAGGRAFPVYGSHDLRTWARLGDALATERTSAHWAPCVRYVPGLARPYVMLYSRAAGVGERGARRAHPPPGRRRAPGGAIRRLGARPDARPRLRDRRRRLPAAGRVAALRLRDRLRRTTSPTAPGSSRRRSTTISPRSWARRASSPGRATTGTSTSRPASCPGRRSPASIGRGRPCAGTPSRRRSAGSSRPRGVPVYLYSGGCFWDFYAVGALVEDETGLRDVTDGERNFVIRPDPEAGFYGPGHCSHLRGEDGADYLMLHARFGAPDAPRQMCLARLRWTDEGLPYAEPVP